MKKKGIFDLWNDFVVETTPQKMKDIAEARRRNKAGQTPRWTGATVRNEREGSK